MQNYLQTFYKSIIYMHILHINSEKDASKIDEMVEEGKDVFIIVYMEGVWTL